MISVTRLICGKVGPFDWLRYERGQIPPEKRSPVVVWNITPLCNLNCLHCYANSSIDIDKQKILSTPEAMKVIDDLAEIKVPVILFSGGEPLLRDDIFSLGEYAVSKGIKVVISSNGTLIKPWIAKKIKSMGCHYVGVSLDGLRETDNMLRRDERAFEMALEGIYALISEGVRVGVRFTMLKRNVDEIPGIFELIEDSGISRCCFYHLVYSGRGSKLIEEDLTLKERRKAIDTIFENTQRLFRRNKDIEVLTVDNNVDGAYLYLKTLEINPLKAEEVMKLLLANGGNGSGTTIGCIGYDGNVYADQFWNNYSFGNVRDRKFSEIWFDTSNELMHKLKDKKKYLKGRCSKCRFLEICAGSSRVRAEVYNGDVWAPDPSCYLTDEEILKKEVY